MLIALNITHGREHCRTSVQPLGAISVAVDSSCCAVFNAPASIKKRKKELGISVSVQVLSCILMCRPFIPLCARNGKKRVLTPINDRYGFLLLLISPLIICCGLNSLERDAYDRTAIAGK